MKKHRIDACDLIFLCTLIPITFFLLWKCPYGYGGLDEPFYLTLAQRLSMGDALLSDEWNLSQLSAVLLLPFYRLHRLLFGTTEGIVLHFRYLYTAVQLLTAALMYLALRRFRYGAVCAVLIFVIYTPYDVMALSYNTFALMAVTLCLSILSCCKKDGRAGFLLAGFCYAVSVIANPYIFLIYLFVLVSYFAAFCVRAFRRRQNVRSAPVICRPERPRHLPLIRQKTAYFIYGDAVCLFLRSERQFPQYTCSSLFSAAPESARS